MSALESLIETKRQQIEAVKAAQQQVDAQRKLDIEVLKRDRIDRMKTDLCAALGDAYAELSIDYETPVWEGYTWWNVKASITDPVSAITFTVNRRYKKESGDLPFSLSWWTNGDSYSWDNLTTATLLPKLLEQIIAARELRRKRDVDAVAEAEAERVHQEILAKIETVKTATLSSAWAWREGVTFNLYVLTYCTAAIRDDEGDNAIEYRSVYTATDVLDERGYITVYDNLRNFQSEMIRLTPAYHKPVWERLTVSSVDDLPHLLRDDLRFTVTGIRREPEYKGDLFVYDEGSFVERTAARYAVPVQWVRDLVDAR